MANSTFRRHLISPLRYPGGKGCIYSFVSELLVENDLVGVNYAEPYAGGAGLALRLLVDEFVSCIHINDLDESIVAFWNSILKFPNRFCDWIEDVKIDPETWRYYKSIHKGEEKGISELDLGKATFYLNRTNVSGVLQGGIIGGLNQKGKYKIDARFNKTNLIERIQFISNYKDRIVVSNLDGVNFVQNINKRKGQYFVYLDPPYVVKGADLYMNFYAKKDHEILANAVDTIKKYWMVSYDNTDFIMKIYDKYRKVTYNLSQSASNRIGKEIIIFDDDLQFENSISKLSSPILSS